MSQRMGWLLLLIFAIIAGCSQGGSKVDTPVSRQFPEATSVRLFLEQQSTEMADEAWKAKHPSGIELSPSQRIQLEAAIYIETNDNKEMAACFIPHHYFRYFNQRGKQIGEISVCFCCAGVRIDPYEKKLAGNQYVEAKYADITKLVDAMGVPTNVECD